MFNEWTINFTIHKKCKQECIPVGCVPAARRPYAGVCFPEGWWGVCVSGRGGVCLVWGVVCLVWVGGVVCLVWVGGWCAWSGGGWCAWSGGVVCLVQGGVCAWSREGSASVPCGIPPPPDQAHPPVNRMTNRCKNITLATTSLRPVKMSIFSLRF